MLELPSGTLTLLFTDIEGSTRLVRRLGDRYPGLLATHRTLLRAAVAAHQGIEIDTEGDALFVAFARATDAVAAAVDGQRAPAAYDWPEQSVLLVRMGLHTGEPTIDGDNYAGYDVHRAARICSSAHGGQIVVSDVTHRLAQEAGCDWEFVELGEHRLKDLADTEYLFQVSPAGLMSQFPPLRSVDAVRTNLPNALTSFVGRDRDLERLEGLVRRHRLVTLTGPGGAGKTRLALRAASELLDEFSDGVWVVRLGSLTDHTRVAQTIADTIGLGHHGRNQSPVDTLADYARDKHLFAGSRQLRAADARRRCRRGAGGTVRRDQCAHHQPRSPEPAWRAGDVRTADDRPSTRAAGRPGTSRPGRVGSPVRRPRPERAADVLCDTGQRGRYRGGCPSARRSAARHRACCGPRQDAVAGRPRHPTG